MKKHLEDLRSLDTQSENFTTSNYHRFRAASKYSSPMHDHFKSTMTHFKRFDVVAWAKLDLQICIQFTVLIILDSYALPLFPSQNSCTHEHFLFISISSNVYTLLPKVGLCLTQKLDSWTIPYVKCSSLRFALLALAAAYISFMHARFALHIVARNSERECQFMLILQTG